MDELRRESKSVFNRVHSIAEDAQFVGRVHAHYPDFSLLPNMRCGAWYTDEQIDTPRAYFKSTDGHHNNWSFSLRRPNLHILSLIVNHAGILLVDSTRAGKRIPDALSKTVPIWCAVLNRAILKRSSSDLAWDTALYTPPGCVSPQEHAQIEARLDAWASQLAASSYSLPTLEHPLRPMWITPATTVFPKPPDRVFYPIICVSASKQVADGIERSASGFTYIQGSGDDHEHWGMGLTPTLYWKHRDEILATRSSDLPDLILSLVSASAPTNDAMDLKLPPCGAPIQHISGRISITNTVSLQRPDLLQAHPDVAFLCLTPHSAPTDEPRMLTIQTPEGKKGQYHFLTVVLPRSMAFTQIHLQNGRTVCIACTTGTDMSIGVALVALAVFFHPDGSLCSQANVRDQLSKDVLKTRLEWIIASHPCANPSRTTLKRVNDFLLSSIPGHPGPVDDRSNSDDLIQSNDVQENI